MPTKWTNPPQNLPYAQPDALASPARCCRYMTTFASDPDPRKALRHCREYADVLAESGSAYPHRNFEVLYVALNTCLWKMADGGWRGAAKD